MKEDYQKSILFAGMSEEDIESCLLCSQSHFVEYKKGSFIFEEGKKPEKLYLLVEGEISIGRYTLSGNKIIVTSFQEPGELFGEVFLFLHQDEYDYYAEVKENARILEIPKKFFYQRCEKDCGFHDKLIYNMLSILSGKAYFLNKKMEILSGNSLRQKIARYLAQKSNHQNQVKLTMNREEMADFLGTTRPSLSRELMNMQQEGIIRVNKEYIEIQNTDYIDELI